MLRRRILSFAVRADTEQVEPVGERATVIARVDAVLRSSTLPGLVGIAAWMTFWHYRASGSLTFAAVGAVVGFVFACTGYGALAEQASSRFVPNRIGVAYRFLIGFFLFDSFLFVLVLLTPFGVAIDAVILAILPWPAVAALRRARRGRERKSFINVDERAGLVCIVVVGAAASMWAREHQPVLDIRGDLAVFRAWSDIFIHVREISAHAQAHGWGSMSDIKMLGARSPPYHFASYATPAAFMALTSTTAFANLGGVQLPLGMLLMGLAALALVGNWWSPWHGVAAAIGVLTLPDGYQQGMPFAYLSFMFMSQVNLTMLYGVASVAIGWLFMIEGCRRASYASLVIAYTCLAATAFFKAHVFVANAYPMLIFPALFFAGWNRGVRAGAFIAVSVLFVAVVAVFQLSPQVPVMRLDGSGLGSYLRILDAGTDIGVVKNAMDWLLFQNHFARIVTLAVGATVVFVGMLGTWSVAAPAALWATRRIQPFALAGFVSIVAANYAIMALGLAIDDRGMGTPEELLNRPMAWAYFVIVGCGSAAIYALLLDRWEVSAARRRWLLTALVVACLTNVYARSFNIQTLRADPHFRDYESFNGIPACLVETATWLRDHSAPDAVVQDSANDPEFVVAAIAERPMYVGESGFAGRAKGQDERLAAVRRIEILADAAAFNAFARRAGIGWFLLREDDSARWPQTFLDSAVHRCDGYRVFRVPA